MADPKKIISLQNLTDYDTLIKKFITDADAVVDAKSLKCGAVVGDTVYFFKSDAVPKKTGSDEVDTTKAAFSFEIASSDVEQLLEDVEEIQGTLTGYSSTATVASAISTSEQAAKNYADAAVKALNDGQVTTNKNAIDAINNETTGILKQAKDYTDTLDNSLADVAKSGAAADVTIADAAEKFTATNVEGALLEVKNIADANATAISGINNETTGILATAKGYTDTKIQGLKKEDAAVSNQFVTAVSEENGVITVSRAALTADDIPTITLAKVSDAGTAAASNVATVAIGATGEVTTALPTVGQVETYVADQIADLEGAMHFVGVITRNEGETDEQAIARVITAPKSGDVVVMADNGKEYIFVDPDPETAGDESWREIGDEGLYVTKATEIAGVAIQSGITKAAMLTALNVADGAQVNVLEGVQVNGADLTVDSSKKVNVTVAEGTANGTIAVNGANVSVHGLGSAAYTDATAYDAAGTAQGLIEGLDATVTTVTELDPTPVVSVSITEVDGKLTAVSASIKDNTFDSYGSASTAEQNAKDYADGLYSVAAKTEIEALFAEE